jgi:hypothetical protein
MMLADDPKFASEEGLFSEVRGRCQPVEKHHRCPLSPQIKDQTHQFWGVSDPICGRCRLDADLFNSDPWPGKGHPEAMKESCCQVYFHTRLVLSRKFALCSARKNGYLAYKRIAIWQTHSLHIQPYTASQWIDTKEEHDKDLHRG